MRLSFTPVVTVAASALLLATAIQAQEARPAHSLVDGAWALQFGIGDNFTLHSFDGTTISAKHQGEAGHALRYGLSLSASRFSADNAQNQSDVSLRLGVQFLRYPTLGRDPDGNIHMYWGFGPEIGFARQHGVDFDDNAITSRDLAVGAAGTLGAEWFVRPRLSLTGEYQSAIIATFHSRSDPGSDRQILQLLQRPVRFGVSVYFR